MSRPGSTSAFGSAIVLTAALLIVAAGAGTLQAQSKPGPDQPPGQSAPPKSGVDAGTTPEVAAPESMAPDGKEGASRAQPRTRQRREQVPPAGCPAIGEKLDLLV